MEATSATTTGGSPKSASRQLVGDVHMPPSLRKPRHGCEHIRALVKESEKDALDRYTKVIQAINSRPSLALHLPKSTKHVTLKPTYLCLQCPAVNSYDQRDLHDPTHKLCAESGSGSLFCRDCGDFVHDPAFEDIRQLRGKKRKYSSLLSDVDSRIVAANTTPTPCRAVALRGLYNMGQTCFMSVVLQSLIHNPFIRAFYLSEGHRSTDCEREACTSCALDDVFVEFHSTEKAEGYGMVAMLQASWRGGGNLAGYQQQDAHEYLQFTLNSLHSANVEDPDTDGQSCTCIIHNIFGGVLQSTVTCSKCKNLTTALDPFMDLSVDVKEKAIKKKKDGAAPVAPERSTMDITECLDRFTSQETLPPSDYTCRKCASAQSATKRMSVSRLPLVLPIHLKRFSHSHSKSSSKSIKLDTRVKFPLTLEMRPYCRLSSETTKKKKHHQQNVHHSAMSTYQLSSVVVHHGKMDSGHYTNYARVNDEWFMFDDSKVVLVDESQVLASEAYMLFYVVREIDV